jgi:hypothetical protein
MAWTTPRTWVTSEMATAALLNTYVRDNLVAVRDQASCRLKRTGAAVAVTTAVALKVNFDATEWDTTGTMADLVNDRITFPDSGKYIIGGHLAFGAGVTGRREMRIVYFDLVANAAIRVLIEANEGIAAARNVLSIESLFDCKAGDYIYMEAFQNSGGNLNYNVVDPTYPVLYAAREGI